MRISSLGNVGIGTTNLSQKLEVAGNVSSTGLCLSGTCNSTWPSSGSVSTSSAITAFNFPYWANTTGGLMGTSTIYSDGTGVGISTTTVSNLLTVGSSTPLVITQGGFIGIGTSSPATLFTVGTTTNIFNVLSNGKVGIGTKSPASRLSVNGGISAGTYSATAAPSDGMIISGNVGIGATQPAYRLAVTGSGTGQSSGAISVIESSVRSWILGAGTTVSGQFSIVNGSTGNDVLSIDAGGNVGIGTSTPQALLSVGTTTTSLVAVFGGGTGKITVGTVDPVYTIGGTKYATYLPGMTGQKEETTGVATLRLSDTKNPNDIRMLQKENHSDNSDGFVVSDRVYEYVIDFNKVESGSDLWLFSKTTNLSAGGGSSSGGKENFDKMTVLLTPAFDGRVWYEKDAKNLRLTIYASCGNITTSQVVRLLTTCDVKNLEVSYRLSAPRFDAANWTNFADPKDTTPGFIISE
jgi:hypothetical protein